MAVGAVVAALFLTLVANPHALPNPHPGKRWSAFTLEQKERYVKANLRHAGQAIEWAKAHRHLYRDKGASVIGEHQRLRNKASKNLHAIELALHPPFQYPWWWVPLGVCETGSNPPDPGYNDGLYEGWINFLNSTWLTYGGGRYAAHAYDASEYEQYLVTLAMHRDVPWSQSNPACSARIGLS